MVITNHTELPLTAVCFKLLLADRLPPGASTPAVPILRRDAIEFQWHEDPNVPPEIWASYDFERRLGVTYSLVVAGTSHTPSFHLIADVDD